MYVTAELAGPRINHASQYKDSLLCNLWRSKSLADEQFLEKTDYVGVTILSSFCARLAARREIMGVGRECHFDSLFFADNRAREIPNSFWKGRKENLPRQKLGSSKVWAAGRKGEAENLRTGNESELRAICCSAIFGFL